MENRDDDPAFRRRTLGKRVAVKPTGLLAQLKDLEARVALLEKAMKANEVPPQAPAPA